MWQPGTSKGVELVDQPGSLCWTELHTSDATAAKEFYGGVLGRRFSDMEMPGGGGTYHLITPAGLPRGADARRPHGTRQGGPRAGRRAPVLAPGLRRRRL
ncbi:hypothetical protein GCM10027162_07580 [Streptomyces incanus]